MVENSIRLLTPLLFLILLPWSGLSSLPCRRSWRHARAHRSMPARIRALQAETLLHNSYFALL
jgi:hypothetical protein